MHKILIVVWVYSFDEYLLNVYYVLGTVLDTWRYSSE